MGIFFNPALFLTGRSPRSTLILTLFLTVLCSFRVVYAYDLSNGFDPHDPANTTLYSSPLATNDQHFKLSAALNYAREQAPSWFPGLPIANLFAPNNWVLNGLRLLRSEIDSEDLNSSILAPSEAMLQRPSFTDPEALWLSPDYHHKGFLPFNDAMVMGVGFRHSLFDEAVRIEARPYYGQSWMSGRGYFGKELALNIHERIGPIEGGKIAVNYITGDSSLTDHGHGIDLHSDIKFSDNVNLQAGVRANENAQFGNYVMLKWVLLTN